MTIEKSTKDIRNQITHEFVDVMWVAARQDHKTHEIFFWTGSGETKNIKYANRASTAGYLDYAGGYPREFRKRRIVIIKDKIYLLRE